VSKRRPAVARLDYWALARTKGGFRLELAGLSPATDWTVFARALLSLEEGVDLLAYQDAGAGQYRFAAFEDGRVSGALFIARDPLSISRSWACEQLGCAMSEPCGRLGLLAGRAAAAREDKGVIVCSCFEVGAKQIASAVRAGRCGDVEQIGKALRAGTNCGSCRPEIHKIIQVHSTSRAG
jgi:assimilatory nitrate reductase catalytic subunit